jgi:uncharacterized protein (TIGR02217 family)
MYLVDQLFAPTLIGQDGHALADQVAAPCLIAGAPRASCDLVALAVLYELLPPAVAYADQESVSALIEEDGRFYTDTLAAACLIEEDGRFYADCLATAVLFGLDELSPHAENYEPMSDYLLPSLPGLAWNTVRRPKFSTPIAPHVSGREVRISNYAYPIWEWEMSYEFLRAGAEQELQTLIGFFLARRGQFDTFLFLDPEEQDNALTAVTVGTGDAAQTKWTLFKTWAGFAEPCGYVDPASVHVYFTASGATVEQTSGWTFVSPNQIDFATPPPTGTVITADYAWYYRVRFGEDSQDYNNFMFNLFELKKMTVVSVKP